jgi:hypothetical protein
VRQRLIGLVVLVAIGIGAYVVWPTALLNTKTTCVYAGNTPASVTTFSKLVSEPVNCAVLFSYSNRDWSQWASPWFTHPSSAGTDWTPWLAADPSARRIVITQEMIPANAPANWRVLGARGAYNGYARRLAANLVAAGMGNAVIRLGHEMNDTTYPDGLGSNPAQYRDWADYFAQIVHAMRAVPGAHFLFDWNVNAGYRDIPLASYYPGNDVVDMIGIDIYDAGMPGNPKDLASRWASLSGEPGGLDQIVAFAKAHHKPLSFPEWGVIGRASGGIGDDPAYMQGIGSEIQNNPVVYQSYFERSSGGVIPLKDAPKSLSVWKQTFGQDGDVSSRPW